MKRKHFFANEIFLYVEVIIALVSISLIVAAYFFELHLSKSVLDISVIALVVSLFLLFISLLSTRRAKNSDIYLLDKLIRYNDKRSEIDYEILRLTKELDRSDVSQYIDINRLAFSGQNYQLSNEAINYENFLGQFGITRDKVKIKKGTAIFLTPFNSEGERVFQICQNIVSRLDVFLQRTDNKVDKDDILMNIVSLIVQSEFVIVNIDGRNPNVYYELGIAHAIGKPTIILSRSDYSIEEIGFDVRQKRIIIYRNEHDLETELLTQIANLRSK